MSRSPRPSYRARFLFSSLIVAALASLSLIFLSHQGGRVESLATAVKAAPVERAPKGGEEVGEAYGKLPLSFVENVGQADAGVRFVARGAGYGLFLTADEAVLALHKSSAKGGERAAVRMKLLRSNGTPQVAGRDQLAGANNYFIGDDPAKWRTDVPAYARVQFGGVYPGVDLVYYGNQRQLEYDFVVAPGAEPRTIALGFEGVDRLEVDAAGELVLHTDGGEVRQRRPVAYQETETGARREVAANYVLKGGREVAFELGDYDKNSPLVIDPVLVYSTYLGGLNSDSGYGVAVDATGAAYVTGTTASDNFPVSTSARQKTRGPYPGRTTANYSDAFVTKLNASGTSAVYSTYLGGGIAGEIGKGIAVDSSGNAYVTGVTGGGAVLNKGTNDFPLVNAYQDTFGGTDDAFVVKLNPTGSALLYSTYLGGDSTDTGERIAVNAATGEAYVTGGAGSATFPTTPGAYKPSSACAGCSTEPTHAYVTKFGASGALDWSTLVGPGTAYDIAIDAAGNSYITGGAVNGTVTGGVYPSNYPVTPGAHQTANGGNDAFVTKLNPFGSALVYSTFLGGGPQSDRAFGIAVDADGNAYVTGQTQNAAFPTTPGAFDVTYNGGSDAFVVKFNADGSDLLYATFIGGTAEDIGRAIALDKARNVYITGQTKSVNYPLKNSVQPKTSGAEVFLTKLNTTGSALVYSTYLGTGDGRDVVYSETYGAYLTGQATQIPVTNNALQTRENTGTESNYYDAFVMRVRSTNETTAVYSIGGKITDTTDQGSPSDGLVTLKLTGAQGRTTNLTQLNSYSFGALPAGTYTVTPSKPGFRFEPASRTFTSIAANQTADFNVIPNAAPVVSITSPAQSSTFTAPASITVTADASDADGSVTEVQFYANTLQGTTVIIGTDTTAPYSVTWTNVAGGEYTIGAFAKDDLGMRGSGSEYIAVSVSNNVPATVALTSPAAGSTYKTGEYVNVSASVTGSGATAIDYVDFFAGTELIARDTTAPYGFSWRPMEAGSFALTARAVDLGKAVGASPAVNVTVNEALVAYRGQVLDGTTPLSGVTVTLSGAKSATATTGTDGKFAFTGLLAQHAYTVTPSKAGLTFDPSSVGTDYMGFTDANVTFNVVRESPVSVMITGPSWGARYTAPATVTAEAVASSTAGPITKVEFYADGPSGKVLIGADTTSPYSFVWRNVAAGSYGVSVVATDSTGATNTSGPNAIIVDPAPTTVAISGQVTDSDGDGMSGIKVTLTGSKTATAVTNLYGYYGFGGLPVGGSYTVTAPTTYVFTPPSYTFNNLTADEIDTSFHTASENSAPSVTVTSPSAGKSVTSPATIALSATASDKDGTIKSVQFFRRTATASYTLGTDTVAPYAMNWGVSTPGTYEIVAVATDNGGLRTTSAPITITVTSGTAAATALDTGADTLAANVLSPAMLDQSFTDPALWFVGGAGKADSSLPHALVPYLDLALRAGGGSSI